VRTPLTRYTTRIQWLSEVMFSWKNGKGSALEYPSFSKSRGAVAGAENQLGSGLTGWHRFRHSYSTLLCHAGTNLKVARCSNLSEAARAECKRELAG
jgi:hypothetical protein